MIKTAVDISLGINGTLVVNVALRHLPTKRIGLAKIASVEQKKTVKNNC